MRFIKFPIATILLGFVFGVLWQHYLNTTLNTILVFGFFSCIGLVLSYYFNIKKQLQQPYFTVFTLLLSLNLGQFSKYNHTDKNSNFYFSNFIEDKNCIKGIVTEELKTTNYYDKFIVKTSSINQHNCKGKLLLSIPKSVKKSISIGDKITFYENPTELVQSFNPFQFNYSKYLNNQNIYYEVKLKSDSKITSNSDKNRYYYLNFVKQKLLNSFSKTSFSNDNYNLLMALLFGEKTTLSKSLTNNYTQAGIIHILAISGLHIALLYSVLLWLLKPLKRFKKGTFLTFFITLVFLWFYALLVGFSASIVRAVVMFTIIAIGKILNRQNNIYNSLAVSALFLLLYNPNYLFDIGFQLSFMAVLSIVLFQQIVNKYGYSKYYLVTEIKSLLLISLVAQIGVLPLTLYYFGQFPLLFLISNIIAIPLSSLILILGLVLIPINFIFPKVTDKLSLFVNQLINWMNEFTAFIVQFDGLILKNIAFHEILILFLYVIIGCIVYFVYFPNIKNLKPFLISTILFQIGYLFLNSKEESNNEFVVFNVMKHNLFVETKNNTSIFYTDNFATSKQAIYAYVRGKFVKTQRIESMKNTFSFQKKILCIDSSSVYQIKQKPEIVILTQSPKLNLTRLISTLKPQQIIADGSNYKSYVKLWKVTCEKENIPFYATSEKGFYTLK